MSAVQIIQTTPMQINLVLPDNTAPDQVNISDYVNILIAGSQDEEVMIDYLEETRLNV